MPLTNNFHRGRLPVDPHDAWTMGDLAQMDAVVAACGLVAQADGWVTPEERKQMIHRMSQSPGVRFFGLHEVTAGFEALKERFDKDLEVGEAAAEAAVSALRGQPGPSHLLIETVCSVAEADGGFDAEEREVILRLCRLLDLDPARYDLIAGEGMRR